MYFSSMCNLFLSIDPLAGVMKLYGLNNSIISLATLYLSCTRELYKFINFKHLKHHPLKLNQIGRRCVSRKKDSPTNFTDSFTCKQVCKNRKANTLLRASINSPPTHQMLLHTFLSLCPTPSPKLARGGIDWRIGKLFHFLSITNSWISLISASSELISANSCYTQAHTHWHHCIQCCQLARQQYGSDRTWIVQHSERRKLLH